MQEAQHLQTIGWAGTIHLSTHDLDTMLRYSGADSDMYCDF